MKTPSVIGRDIEAHEGLRARRERRAAMEQAAREASKKRHPAFSGRG